MPGVEEMEVIGDEIRVTDGNRSVNKTDCDIRNSGRDLHQPTETYEIQRVHARGRS